MLDIFFKIVDRHYWTWFDNLGSLHAHIAYWHKRGLHDLYDYDYPVLVLKKKKEKKRFWGGWMKLNYMKQEIFHIMISLFLSV